MLENLTISNYALIENLTFSPGKGLSILTGDTGAGKSIMIRALCLVAGERADTQMIGDKTRKAVVEASFAELPAAVKERIRKIDDEWDEGEIIIRREINPSGRSRAFLNDSPVSLSVLAEIARDLFDIHSQHGILNLSNPQFQLDLVDSMSEVSELLADYRKSFSRYVGLRHAIREYHEKRKDSELRRSLDEANLRKLDALKPKKGELELLEKRYDTLSHSEAIREKLSASLEFFTSDDPRGAIENLSEARQMLSNVDFSAWGDENADFNRRLEQCLIELKDLAETLGSTIEKLNFEPEELIRLESRINDYNQTVREMKVAGDSELVDLHENLKLRLDLLEGDENEVEEKEREARALAIELKEKAATISAHRKEGARRLEESIMDEAKKLGLENIKFHIRFSETKLGRSGGDAVEFMSAINKNQELMAVSRFASGGEMARMMLAIKKITAGRMQSPTVIFDEIDTGVSGNIADRMGEMMREMGAEMQIIAITHLPQVASKGRRHFKVFKTDNNEKTVSDIKQLTDSEREMELARMLSGRNINDAAVENARTLLKDSNYAESKGR